jgi:hypothetical protein
MANEEGWRGPEGLQPDPLAEQLAPDGAAVLVGILGKGPTEDDWYLFLDRELTRRAEFKTSDVLHSEKIRAEDPPFLGTQGTRLYLRRGARVVYTATGSREVQAGFLGGAIVENSLAASSGMTGTTPATAWWPWPPTNYHPPDPITICPLAIRAVIPSVNAAGGTSHCCGPMLTPNCPI